MTRIVVPLIAGVVGFALLMSLGLWQVRRLAWKESILAEIEARIAAAPAALPAAPDDGADQYMPVAVTGTLGEPMLRVLVSQKGLGAGYRIVSPLDTGGRRVMVDRGIVPVDLDVPPPPAGQVTVTGNLLWPDEIDGFTPDPDPARNLWFARDLPAMAAELGTEPVLVVARETSFDDAPVVPLPVSVTGIPNDHLGYAVTWFSLAVIWAGMTGYFAWRMRRPKTEGQGV